MVVIRGGGSRGLACARCSAFTGALSGQGLGEQIGPDHRRPFLRRHARLVVGHVTPRKPGSAGLIAFLKTGDSVTIDARRQASFRGETKPSWAKRRAAWVKPEPARERGVLAKYARPCVGVGGGDHVHKYTSS